MGVYPYWVRKPELRTARVVPQGFWVFATDGGNLKATREFVLREIAGEHILIPVGETAQKLHGMLNLSESGLLLWNTLQEERTEEELVEALLVEYEVDRATADVRAFIGQMEKAGMLLCGEEKE